MERYERGSEWRKWDLHIHTPKTKLYDNYKSSDIDVWEKFCDVLERSDVDVFGLTDYFSVDNYFFFIDKFLKKYPDSKKKFFPNIELRLNESVNPEQEEVNLHLIFNTSSKSKIKKFLSHLQVVKTGKDETPIVCNDLTSDVDYKSASVTRDSIKTAFEVTFGKKAIRQDHFLIVTSANNDGIRPKRGKQRKEIITDEIDKFSDSFFGGIQNVKHFLMTNRLEDKKFTISKKPVVSGCDAHSFEDLNKSLGQRLIDKSDVKEKIISDITWIKAEPTFEGLKQILYEPESGERVKIGPIKPDQKDSYKVISKMRFLNIRDFPKEIEFNQNLCSIIGSRSSGKSALLAYLAHAIDKDIAESLIEGPGEGTEYNWDKINIEHSIEWANETSSNNSNGKIVYIPQNYLFSKSKDSNEIKERIKPVLFKILPDFKAKYEQAERNISLYNQSISGQIENWFDQIEDIESLKKNLKDLGDKTAVEKEKQEIESIIEKLKNKNKLSDDELMSYQEIYADLLKKRDRKKAIEMEISQIPDISEEKHFFNNLKLNFSPALINLPQYLQNNISTFLKEKEDRILEEANEQVLDYKKKIEKEKSDIEALIITIKEDKKSLIEQYKNNIELEKYVKKLNEYQKKIEKIDIIFEKKKKLEEKVEQSIIEIKSYMEDRDKVIKELEMSLNKADQSVLRDIKFGLEYGYNENIEEITNKINTKEKSDFIENGTLSIDKIKDNTGELLSDLYFGKQKINKGYEKKKVAKDVFMLTEKILFNAEMEGDKIGGFSGPTMTPGKRALFLLRLILAESEDTWPLLIDQPEDDLDSRSIYDDIVPFLKEKKKERQIIMVSHNANLVIGADSEQVIVANRNGTDRKNADGKQFNYLAGSLEYSKVKENRKDEDTLKSQGICEHACKILDGGKTAFEKRKHRYHNIK